jgi:hypothetical protein
LAIGLIQKEEIINWADEEILAKINIDTDLIELSLSGSKTISQLLVVMNLFEGKANYEKVIKCVLAYSSMKDHENEIDIKRLIQEISLLKAEAHIGREITHSINKLEWDLEKLEKRMISREEMQCQMKDFFSNYTIYEKEIQSIFRHEW